MNPNLLKKVPVYKLPGNVSVDGAINYKKSKSFYSSYLVRFIAFMTLAVSCFLSYPDLFATQSVTVAGQKFELTGVENSRDIGGYKTKDGKTIKRGILFRTAALENLAPDGAKKLLQNHVSKVIDFRTDMERLVNPDYKVAGIDYVTISIVNPLSSVRSVADLKVLYHDFVLDPLSRQSYAKALREVIANPNSTLYHCTSGKDRTGWFTVLIYEILKVDRATIREDYLLSNKFWNAEPFSIRGVDISYLDTAYKDVQTNFGNFNTYLTRGIGITQKEIKAIRKRLLT